MSLPARDSRAVPRTSDSADDAAELSRLEARLPLLLSMIAGMVDSTGFFTLGHVFTAHVTGNIVLAAGVAVDGGSFHWAQLLAIPVFNQPKSDLPTVSGCHICRAQWAASRHVARKRMARH